MAMNASLLGKETAGLIEFEGSFCLRVRQQSRGNRLGSKVTALPEESKLRGVFRWGVVGDAERMSARVQSKLLGLLSTQFATFGEDFFLIYGERGLASAPKGEGKALSLGQGQLTGKGGLKRSRFKKWARGLFSLPEKSRRGDKLVKGPP